MSALEPPALFGGTRLPNGCMLYWQTDPATKTRTYSSDEVGGGVHVWDVALVDSATLLAAIVKEEHFRRLEAEIARRAKEPS